MRPLLFLLRKEFLQIFRDRVILGMLFVIPIVQMLLLANATTFEVRSAQLYVVDQDRSRASRGLVDRLEASGRFVLTGAGPSVAQADREMLNRRADVILTVPHDFERTLVRERRAPVQMIFNAEDGAAASVTRSYVQSIVAAYATELAGDAVPAATRVSSGSEAPPRRGSANIELRERGWYNPELDYRAYMIPAILVVLVTIVGSLLTAMNIVREKEAGTLEQLNVTPISRTTFIAAKLIPLWSLALLDLGVGLGVAKLAFDIPIRGSLAVIFLGAAIYLLVALGIGLWVSSVSSTQQQAMFVTYSILLIYLLMSGLFTPVRGMPEWAQVVAQLSPVMHFTQLMRAVLLKGAGIMDVARELAWLSVMGAVVLTVSVRRYSKRTT